MLILTTVYRESIGLAVFLFRPSTENPLIDLSFMSHLCGGDVLDGTLVPQIPDDHEASSITNNNLVWVDWVLL